MPFKDSCIASTMAANESGASSPFQRVTTRMASWLPTDQEAQPLEGHGLPGEAANGRVTLPPYGAWFGKRA